MKIKSVKVLGDGMSRPKAEAAFEDIRKFSNYGFNKSHAAAYALIGYQTAWLKVHYPAEYLSALMTYYTDKPDRLALIKEDLDGLGVPLLLPDVNASHGLFRPEPCAGAAGGFAVRFGLAAVKQVSGASADLSGERAARGPFADLEDFHRRTAGRFNKGQLERLAEAGAFDGLARTRRAASDAMGWLAGRKDKAPAGQADMFGGVAAVRIPADLLRLPEWGNAAEREFKAVGFYVSLHPIDPLVERLKAAGVRRRLSVFEYMRGKGVESMESRKLCAMVDNAQVRQSHSGTTYVDAQMSERGDSYFVSFYPRNGQKVDDIREILDCARADRKPVVVLCSVAMNREGSGLRVFGRGVWPAEKYLDEVRGDMLVRIDPGMLRPRGAEAAAARGAEAEFGASSPQATAARATAVAAAFEDTLDLLRRALSAGDASEGAERAVHVGTPDGAVRELGRFRINSGTEAVLASSGGVVGIIDYHPAAAARPGPPQGEGPRLALPGRLARPGHPRPEETPEDARAAPRGMRAAFMGQRAPEAAPAPPAYA